MALIKCPECGKEISDKASCCPNCGCPKAEWKSPLESENKVDDKPITSETQDNIYAIPENNIRIDCGQNRLIMIQNGIMTVANPVTGKVSDSLGNFTLEYFGISMGFNVGMCIYNREKEYTSSVFDVIARGEKLELLKKFKNIMERNGLFSGRSRVDMLYRQTEEDKYLRSKGWEAFSQSRSNPPEEADFNGIYKYGVLGGKTRVYCPRCGSEDCSHYQEQKIKPGKNKTRYTANLNPLRPFTLVNKKEKVIRKEKVITEKKIICNKCGYIFL